MSGENGLTGFPQQEQLQNLSYGSRDLHARGSHFQESKNPGRHFFPHSVSRIVFIEAIINAESTTIRNKAKIYIFKISYVLW